MRVTKEQMAEHRRRILEAAGRLFREKGFEAVTVAEVMQAAGLTHGGFYGHFKSKDELIAQTLEQIRTVHPEGATLADYAAGYLTEAHRDEHAGGCSFAALGGDTIRQSPEARAAMTERLRRQIARLTALAPGRTEAEKRKAALAGWSAMVGALVLARISDDPELSRELLDGTRDRIAKAQ
ncbi:MAG TPA: TetR family transcriptional regulator [Dongiaceae bacterium]|nr:TetR family transcriptional regulator [Dongiaceae bacterium]